jgi:hypothetical protein
LTRSQRAPSPEFQAQVGVALLGGVPPGVEEASPPFLPLPLQGQKGLAGEVFALQLLKEFSPTEDHLAGVLAQFPGRVQGGLGLLYGPVGVSGVEAEEGAEGAALPFELLPGLTLQEAPVGVACSAGEAAHEVQDGLLVFLLEKDEAGVSAEEDSSPFLYPMALFP